MESAHPSMPPPLLTDAELTDEQRAWVPASFTEAWEVWPNGWRIEVLDGVIIYTNGAGPDWDWKSVAMAARCYPGWRVELIDLGVLTVHPPGSGAG
jgi:hypothetical protein